MHRDELAELVQRFFAHYLVFSGTSVCTHETATATRSDYSCPFSRNASPAD